MTKIDRSLDSVNFYIEILIVWILYLIHTGILVRVCVC